METGNWKLETGNWKLETGNWKLETGNWKLETGNWKLETGCLSLLSYPPHYQDFLYLKRVNFRLSCHPEQSEGSHYCSSVPRIKYCIIALQMVVKLFFNTVIH